jgi:pimeloyl-ACP methyl ester carboxylesterase
MRGRFAHGFGCDQNMWRFVAPSFEPDYRVVLFDHVGAGGSDLSAYKSDKYASLSGYADDVVEIGRELGLRDAVFVGHSVSAMIGAFNSVYKRNLRLDRAIGAGAQLFNDLQQRFRQLDIGFQL